MSTERADILSVPDHVQSWNFRQQVPGMGEPDNSCEGYYMAEWRLIPWPHQFAIYKVVEYRGFASGKGDPNLFRNIAR